MSEFDEFAEALMGQLSVEIDEEKVISELAKKIKEDRNFAVKFDGIESVSQKFFADLIQRSTITDSFWMIIQELFSTSRDHHTNLMQNQ